MSDDSARASWSGRQLTSTGFDGDVGAADPNLIAALDDPQDEPGFLRAMAQARLLVPIVAAPAAPAARAARAAPDDATALAATDADFGKAMAERSTDLSVVTVVSSDGQRGFPVFSSLAMLSAWDVTARPSPVTSARAAQTAVTERCDVMLLDLGSGHERVLRPSMVWALAQQRDWLPAHTDPFVAQALSRATAPEVSVIGCVGEGDPAKPGLLRVVLSLRAGLDEAEVQALATRIGERIAADGEARARIDGLAFTIRRA